MTDNDTLHGLSESTCGLYARTAIRLAEDHLAHCDGDLCDISLAVLCEMAEKAGARFSEIEKRLFL